MDFIVRYFKDSEVKSRYLSSGFSGHTTAKDLKRAFEECTEKLDLKTLIQVSMDGPNVNWKIFRTGMKQTGWGIGLLLKPVIYMRHQQGEKITQNDRK